MSYVTGQISSFGAIGGSEIYDNVVIVSRHPAAVEFIKNHLKAAGKDPLLVDCIPVITGNATAADVADKFCIGNIPFHLAVLAEEVGAVEFSGTPPRGAEYTAEDMAEAGATVRWYKVFHKK